MFATDQVLLAVVGVTELKTPPFVPANSLPFTISARTVGSLSPVLIADQFALAVGETKAPPPDVPAMIFGSWNVRDRTLKLVGPPALKLDQVVPKFVETKTPVCVPAHTVPPV